MGSAENSGKVSIRSGGKTGLPQIDVDNLGAALIGKHHDINISGPASSLEMRPANGHLLRARIAVRVRGRQVLLIRKSRRVADSGRGTERQPAASKGRRQRNPAGSGVCPIAVFWSSIFLAGPALTIAGPQDGSRGKTRKPALLRLRSWRAVID